LPKKLRRLFLDDDPGRAEVFLARHPDAVWVQDAPGCVARLAETWDEVHLDHDLGGEVYVDSGREDCGMAVVRWLALEPRPHLRNARFTVHSHNMMAALAMIQGIRDLGFRVEARPFGLEVPEVEPPPGAGLPRPLARALAMVRRLGRRTPVVPSGPPDGEDGPLPREDGPLP